MSPRARRAARERGIDPSTVSGTGRNGRVRERDLLAYAVRARAVFHTGPGPRILPTRRAIADRLLHSLRTTAPVTLTTTADAANLVSLRGQFRAVATDAVPSFTDFLVKLTALALRRHPTLASRLGGGPNRPTN
ncbi:MAG: E3 binding domain-containing protein [Gemmataceae bacterium]